MGLCTSSKSVWVKSSCRIGALLKYVKTFIVMEQACWSPSFWWPAWQCSVFVWKRLQCAKKTSEDHWRGTRGKQKVLIIFFMNRRIFKVIANPHGIYLGGSNLFVILSTCFNFAAENVLIEKITFFRKMILREKLARFQV